MLEAKDITAKEAAGKVNAEREKMIAKQWLSFSKQAAGKDLLQYGHDTSDMLTDYAKEKVMPSPVGQGEEITIDTETASSLLQNARGCDIILSYVEQYIDSSTNK